MLKYDKEILDSPETQFSFFFFCKYLFFLSPTWVKQMQF